MPEFYELLRAAAASGEPFALAIISAIKGSSPQKKGAKALFFADGRIVGTVGGGCLEAEIQDRARRALLTGQPATFEFVLDNEFGWEGGLICGGKVSGLILPNASAASAIWQRLAAPDQTLTWGVRPDFTIGWVEAGDDCLYFEKVSPPTLLWIAGSGHVAQAVAPLAMQVGFQVTVFDDRPAFANRQHFPKSAQLRVGPWDQLLAEPLPGQPTFGLIATRGHQHDALVLKTWIRHPFLFLGMLGSRHKARLFHDQFLAEGLATRDQLARLACPVGLEIQSVTVPEIAISIVAQLVQKRAQFVYGLEPRPV